MQECVVTVRKKRSKQAEEFERIMKNSSLEVVRPGILVSMNRVDGPSIGRIFDREVRLGLTFFIIASRGIEHKGVRHDDLILRASKLFSDAFSGPPYFDPWTQESAFEIVLSKFMGREGAALILVNEGSTGETVGLCGMVNLCAFTQELKSSGNTVALEKIERFIALKNVNPQGILYLDFIAVDEHIRNNGLGGLLMEMYEVYASLSGYNGLMFRTATEAMIHLASKHAFTHMFDDNNSGREEVKGALKFRRYFFKQL